MTDYLKKIVSEIHKQAQVPTRSKGPKAAPSTSGNTSPVTMPSRQQISKSNLHQTPAASAGQRSSSTVKSMQSAIQKLAQTFSSAINYDAINSAMQSPANFDKKEFEASFGRDAFSNFIVNKYLRNSAVKGVEYDPNPAKAKIMQKSPADLKDMSVILDSLKRIGSDKSEKLSDGVWGPRTTNALKNVAAIADAVMKLGTELGMKSTNFDVNKIADLTSLITAESMEEKIKNAPAITAILNGVNSLLIDFKSQVFQDPTYANIISGRKPLFSFSPAQQGVLTEVPAEQSIYKDLAAEGERSKHVANNTKANFQIVIPQDYVNLMPGITSSTFTINAANLLNEQAFDAWINKNSMLMNLKESKPETFNNLVKEILNQVQTEASNFLGGK